MLNTLFNGRILLLCSFFLSAPAYHARAQQVLEAGSRFVHGFARVQQDSQYYYIDTAGQHAFDRVLDGDGTLLLPVADADGTIPGADTANGRLPQYFNHVLLGKKQGVLGLDGKWILQPEYDTIDTSYPEGWTVTNNGKSTRYTANGFALPFRFETVYNMDDRFFNVKDKDKWGVYDKQTAKLVVPCVYEDMDYCYGCGAKGDYVFAQKDGKWGVLNFKNEVLLPFEYDHEHGNMRSDEWVQCLYKNDQRLLINLRTKVVTRDTCNCSPDDADDTEPVIVDGFKRTQKGKWYGLVNASGKQVLPALYDGIIYDGTELPKPLVRIDKGKFSGVADTSGRIIIPPLYDSYFEVRYDSLILATKGNKKTLFNTKGRTVLPGIYEDIRLWQPFENDTTTAFFKVQQGQVYGIYNAHTCKLVPAQFSYIFDADTATGWVKVEKLNKQGFIDTNGVVIVPPQFDEVMVNGKPNQVRVSNKFYKVGIYDYVQHRLVIPMKYTAIAPVEHTDLYFLQEDETEGEGLAAVDGRMIYPFLRRQRLDQLDTLGINFMATRRDSLSEKLSYTLFNTQTHAVTPLPFDTVIMGGYKGRVGVHFAKDQYGLYDITTQEMVKGAYAENGFPQLVVPYLDKAVIMKHGKIGVIRPDGSVLIPAKYDLISPISEHLALFMLRDGDSVMHYGFGDSAAHMIVPMTYDFIPDERAEYYQDSMLVLTRRDEEGNVRRGLAEMDGRVILPPLYDKINKTTDGKAFLVRRNGRYGIIRRSGEVLLPAEFDNLLLSDRSSYLEEVEFDLPIAALKNGEWRYYNGKGQVLPQRMKNTIQFTPPVPGDAEIPDTGNMAGSDNSQENIIVPVEPAEPVQP